MGFNSYIFVLFLLGVYFISLFLRRWNDPYKIFLSICSYIFYAWSHPLYLLLLLSSTVLDFYFGLAIESAHPKKKKIWLWSSITLNLGILGYFKYANFFLDNIGLNGDLDILLPIGVSFYTFASLSYIVDVYRGSISATRKIFDYIFYVSFFAHLVAGPIVWARDFLPQLRDAPKHSTKYLAEGLSMICFGYFLKTVIADNISIGVDNFYLHPANYNMLQSWYYVFSYSIQIFGDFAGYSYIGIGVARLFGYHFPPNFNYPYLATSLTDFWRRWHISLSSWLKEYLYVSLGGNRKGLPRTYINLMVTMVLGGLWHGASWNFVFWGAIHGTWLGVEKFINQWQPAFYTSMSRPVIFLRWAMTIFIVTLAWVFFRSQSVSDTKIILKNLFSLEMGSALIGLSELNAKVPIMFCVALYIFVAIGATTYIKTRPLLLGALLAGLVFLSVTMGLNAGSFIYFAF